MGGAVSERVSMYALMGPQQRASLRRATVPAAVRHLSDNLIEAYCQWRQTEALREVFEASFLYQGKGAYDFLIDP